MTRVRSTQAPLRSGLALFAVLCACGDDGGRGDGDGDGDGSRPDAAASHGRDAASSRDADHDAAAGADASSGPVAAVPPEVLAHADDWPLPNRDYDNTRASFTAGIDSSNVHELSELWRHALPPAGAFGGVTANPLILGDAVYLQDMSSHVSVLERDTGELRWHHRDGGLTVGPNGVAVGWGRVYANLGDTGFIALDADDGEELWRFEPALTSSEGVDIQPTVYGGTVYVSTVPASLRGGYLGGSRGIVHALDHATGKPLWTFDTVDTDDLWGDPARNSGGGAWYPPLIDLRRDMLYWGTGNPGPWPGTADFPSGRSRPGDNLYTSSLVALDRRTGELEWFRQERAHDLFDWDFQNAPMFVEANIDGVMRDLVIGSGKTGSVVAHDADDGALVWRTEVGRHENDDLDDLDDQAELPVGDAEGLTIFPGALGGVLTATAYADGVIFAPVVNLATVYKGDAYTVAGLVGEGELVALEAVSGQPIWSQPLEAASYGAATVVNDLVFTSDANGKLYAFERERGELIWSYQAYAGINAPLAVAGDMLLIPVGMTGQPALVALGL